MGMYTIQRSGPRSVRLAISWGPRHTQAEVAEFQRALKKLVDKHGTKRPARAKRAARKRSAR